MKKKKKKKKDGFALDAFSLFEGRRGSLCLLHLDGEREEAVLSSARGGHARKAAPARERKRERREKREQSTLAVEAPGSSAKKPCGGFGSSSFFFFYVLSKVPSRERGHTLGRASEAREMKLGCTHARERERERESRRNDSTTSNEKNEKKLSPLLSSHQHPRDHPLGGLPRRLHPRRHPAQPAHTRAQAFTTGSR